MTSDALNPCVTMTFTCTSIKVLNVNENVSTNALIEHPFVMCPIPIFCAANSDRIMTPVPVKYMGKSVNQSYASTNNKTEMSYWGNFPQWLHRKVSTWQLSVQQWRKFPQNYILETNQTKTWESPGHILNCIRTTSDMYIPVLKKWLARWTAMETTSNPGVVSWISRIKSYGLP